MLRLDRYGLLEWRRVDPVGLGLRHRRRLGHLPPAVAGGVVAAALFGVGEHLVGLAQLTHSLVPLWRLDGVEPEP
jgi:hypothetical protein